MIFDQNKPKLVIWKGFRQLFPNFQPSCKILADIEKFSLIFCPGSFTSPPYGLNYPEDLETNWDRVAGTQVYFKEIRKTVDGKSARVKYEKAEAICKELSLHANLASINNQNEYRHIARVFKYHFVWTSLTGPSNSDERGDRTKWSFRNGALPQDSWWLVDEGGERPHAGYSRHGTVG